MELIFKEIGERLMEYLAIDYANKFTVQYPTLKWFDLFNNQVAKLEATAAHGEHPIPYPCIFMEFADIEWSAFGDCQKGKASIRFHVVQESYADSFFGTDNSKNQNQALNILRYLKQVNTVLHNFASSNMTIPLKRVKSEQDTEHENIISHIIEYTCTIVDESTNPYIDWEQQVIDDFIPIYNENLIND